jgi:hypothetical protein
VEKALIELHYLPCIAWFSALASVDCIIVEKFEHYQKQSFRNRCYIKGPHRIESLIVPISTDRSKSVITEVRIDYSQKWLNNHWRTIQSGYGKAPFFEYYAPELNDLLFKKPVFLYELNFQIMTLCLKWLKKEAAVMQTVMYDPQAPAGVKDLRGLINPKKEDGCNRFYESIEYQQVFGSMFVPNLSLIDLIFNKGPGAWDIVKASGRE